MNNSGVNSRELIATMLLSISREEEYSHILIRNVLDKYDYLDTKEKAFIKCVTEGCVERRIELDYIIDSFSKTPVRKMKPFIRELMRMSTYQIVFLDKVPDSAAINEAVKLAKKKGFTGLSGFVNGVLRNVSRDGKNVKYPSKDTKENRSVVYSMPEWIIDELDSYIGKEKADRVFEAFLETRPVIARISSRLSEEESTSLIKEIEDSGVEVCNHNYLSRCLILKHLNGVNSLPGFGDGRLTIQDISSQLAVSLAGIKEGDTVVDVCAAPGGKSIFAAELAGDKGRVISRDLNTYKTAQIREAALRMKVTNIDIEEWDATEFDSSLEGKADVVIADLPCLGLGVIGRKRDIKYRTLPTDIKEITRIQRDILSVVSKYVKKGGTLIYSTCSVSRAENVDNAEWIEKKLGFKPVDLTSRLSNAIISDVVANSDEASIRNGRLQLLPGLYESDGFFVSCFVRE